MKRTILSLVSMAFICAMTLTSCKEFIGSLDNPVGSYLEVDGPELYVAEGSSIDVACATISDGNVTFTAADAKVIKVEKIGAHLAKVTGLKVGETDLIVKLAATEYYKGADAKVKIIVKPTYSLKDAVVDGAKLKIGYVFNKKECVFAYEFDGDKKVFNLLSGNSTVPEGLEDDYDITMTYDGETTMTHKLVSKKDPTVVPFLLNLYVSDSYDRVFSVAQEMKSVQVNNYEMLPYVPESVTPVDILTPGLLPDNMAVGDKGVYPINIFPDNATNQVIKYTSSDPNVITIDAAGNFECVAAGTATIKAEATDGSGKFVEKEITVDLSEATVTTPPTAKTGIKAGENAAIINAGVATGGTMMYKVTTANTKPTTTDGFSATVPTAQNLAAGTCYVWYYVKADATHADSDIEGSVSVTIASAIISTKDASETFTPSANTVTGTYFRVSGFKFLYGWRVGYNGNTITISSPDGLNLSQVVFTVGNQPSITGRNKSHLQVDHGTLTVTGTSQGSTITISGINSPSVTLSAPSATNTNEMWTISQAVVNGKGDASK